MDYTKWPTKLLSVQRLRLDYENPRLATSVKRPTQRELIEDLIEHEKVLELSRLISKQGYFPNEVLIAFKEGSNTIVAEGNRRLASLKLLLNPELAPSNVQKRVQQYADRAIVKVDKIPVLIAPSREAADPMIIARHDGDAIARWSPVMQARFVQSRIDHGNTIDDVADVTGLERVEVIRRFRDAKLYDVIRSLELPASARQLVDDPRRFPFTTLRRLVEYSSVQKLLGIETSEKFGFVTTLPGERFQEYLKQILVDMADEVVSSRTHNKAAEVAQYVKGLEKKVGVSKKTGRSKAKKTPADEFVDPSRVQPKPRKRAKKAAKRPRVPVGLIPRGFRVDVEDDRISELVDELKSLRLTQYPNASAITFRSLLDMAVTRYIYDIGHLSIIKKRVSKKSPKARDWVPTLNQQLVHILQEDTIPLGPEARKSLQKFVSDTNKSLTLDALNWFTHNRYVPPTVDQLRAFWTMLIPLMELTLQESDD